jgi:DNA-binding transcriptional ArsR family regulator
VTSSDSVSSRLLKVFANNVRAEIAKLLLHSELISLSDIAGKLHGKGIHLSLPGLLKHMDILEDAGIVRKEPGWILREPDARKTVYFLEGKERVERILQLFADVVDLLVAGEIFKGTSKLARIVDGFGPKVIAEERKQFKILVEKCESHRIYEALTEDERKKVKLWKLMLTL